MTRRDRILLFIDTCLREKKRAPSIREICAHEGIKSTSLIHRHLLRLEECGLITREKFPKARALCLTEFGCSYLMELQKSVL
jgi:SOS-response transcriptional repressor LexA